ncbi:MAG: CpXC domain-containing protein [Lentisphaeria bacterium]|jgi:transcription elongation factor Elf1
MAQKVGSKKGAAGHGAESATGARRKGAAEPAAELAAMVPGTVKCPKCGAPQAAAPVTVLRPDDGALGLLFQGTLNLFTCAACGVRFKLEVALLYRDDARRRIVYYVPPEDAPTPAAAEAQVAAILQGCFGGGGAEKPECRLALSRQEFIEKIALLRAGLDDRLVEFIKYQLYLRHEAAMDPRQRQLFYDFSLAGRDDLGFILFDRATGKAQAGAHVPMAAYRELEDAWRSSAELKEEIGRLFPGFHVSAATGFA